ncbi:unnamed protein product [Schistosoma rodhaini]|uniref:Uncharacterized protein n=1 Tax=Schistosoma rodhaini TaxID=6188 RepID=A0AA85FG47_9TREM|nr:unnamed protein product [Schistosoma rodhaini]
MGGQQETKDSATYGSYYLQIAFNPIMGLDEDIEAFTEEFADFGSPRFVDFVALWKKYKMIHLIQGRQNQHGLYDIVGCIFHRLVSLFQPTLSKNKLVRICALYLLYAFHGKQPIRNHVHIRVCPKSWSWILQVATEARDEGHLDVYYVFRKLCAANAFLFCAMRQVLYPGAPLFDSPAVNQYDFTEDHAALPDEGLSDVSKATFSHRRDLLTCSLPVVKALQAPSGLNQTVQCLNMSLSRYAEAKRLLTQKLRVNDESIALDSSKTQGNEGMEDPEEEYLPGLNLVTFPDSLNRIEMLSMELENSTKQTCLKNRFTSSPKRSIHSPSVDVKVPDIENIIETPRVGIVVGAGIVGGKVKSRKNAENSPVSQTPDKKISKQSSSQSPSKITTSNSSKKSEETTTEVKEAVSWGERIRLLKRPSTWAKELAEQAESVYKDGCRRSRRRPTEPKVITASTSQKQQRKIYNIFLDLNGCLQVMSPVTLRNENKPQLPSNLSRRQSQKLSLAKDSIQSKNYTNSIPNNHSTILSSKLKETVASKSNDILDNRLNQLDDSTKELLSYYRHKVETLTEDHETVQRRLDKIYDAIGNQESLSLELNQRDAEISELQRALSDMQVYLFQEREHVLRLYAENDRLKIRELDDRCKIQHLLQLSNLGPNEITYFLKQPNIESQNVANQEPVDNENGEHFSGDENRKAGKNTAWISAMAVKPIIPTAPSQGIMEFTASGKTILKPSGSQIKSDHKNCSNLSESSKSDTVSRIEHEAVLRELEMSKSSLRALQTQLEEQTRNAREQIDSLMEDRKAIQEEMNGLRKRYEEKLRTSSEQLRRCQGLLYDSTKEFLAQRNQFRQAEKVWILEKDKLLSQISVKKLNSSVTPTLSTLKTGGRDTCYSPRDKINNTLRTINTTNIFNNTQNLETHAWIEFNQQKQIQLEKTIDNLEHQLDQLQKLSDMYRDQVIQLEEELVRAREEGVMSKDVFKDQAHKLHERVQVMAQRYQNLERRRQLEMEGYRTDISVLRKKLKEVERQLLKDRPQNN